LISSKQNHAAVINGSPPSPRQQRMLKGNSDIGIAELIGL